MKRIILIIGVLLLGLAVRAQSVTYTCRYWFDQNFAQAATATFSASTWQAELDVGSLTEGLHALHLHVMDTSMKWSAPQSYLFLKLTPPAASTDFTYYYWFDQDHASMQSGALGDGHLLLDVDDLSEGLHAIHVMLKGGEYSASQTYLFFKSDAWESGTPNYVYHCWFDEDFEHQQIDSLGDGHLLLDVNDLEDGLHTVHVMLQGSTLTATQSYMFMKMAVEDPSAELQYICWFDQNYGSAQIGSLGSGLFELEVSDLPNGIHTVNVQLDNGTRTATQCYLFYKQPLGGYGIARWEYWLNDEIANRQITNISPTVDTLNIVSLFNVGHPALRSSCFHFHPNGDAPYINAKNQINFRFYDSELRIIDKSAYYVDEQVQQDIVATVFERNTSETFAAPRNNQIQWLKVEAGVGDSLAFVADKACTMQLFAPSGEEVYAATASETMVVGGCHAWEDGTYYLAVHDVTGSGEMVSVMYQYVHKYAVLAYDVHLVGNGGCSTITFQGNGFNSLLDVYLVNAQNDTIPRLDIGHESNTTTMVTFNFYQVNLGVYDAVFEFYEETIRINGALEVQEPVDIVLTSSVSYPSQFLRNTACTYTYTIINNGNMTAYAVPIYIYIATASTDSISYIKFEGIKLPSIVEGIDTEFLSDIEIETMHDWANSIDDMHCFNMIRKNIGNEGDSITVRSNYFFITMAPYETKSINLKISSNEVINVQTTIPNEFPSLIPFENDSLHYVFDRANNNFADWYCCVREDYECEVDVASHLLEHASYSGTDLAMLMGIGAVLSTEMPHFSAALWTGAGSTLTAAQIAGILGMAVDDFGSRVKFFGSVTCGESGDFLSNLRNAIEQSNASMRKSLFNALVLLIGGSEGIMLSQLNHWNEIYQAAINGSDLFNVWLHGSEGVPQCIWKYGEERPGCPPPPPIGGESTPVNSLDPNDIHGYLSESGSHYMRQEIQNVQYEIEFENDTTLATAAAHTIIVRDTLDATKFDLNTLAARSVTIGDKRLELNGEQTFARTLDMRPELYVIAQIEQDYDPATGIVEWTIQSLDPMTMEPTDNPYQGVLPVNYFGNGVGFIDYSINVKQAFADGTAISNRAGIIFDQEEVIMTPTWTNIVDAVKPTSHIEEVTFEDDTLNFSFISSDNRSGVWYHTLYYRNDSTYQEWQVKVPRIFENSYMLRFKEYQTTEYLVMAVDSAGNVEDKEMVAEYVHYYDGPASISQTMELTQGWNWWSTGLAISLNDLKATLEATGNTSITIKSKSQNIYYQNGRWRGSLNFDVAQMYKIYVGSACEIMFEGVPVNPSAHPITIHNGPNWIGYPLDESMTLDAAFAGFAVNGDVIKHKGGSANYLNGHWRGAFILEPGKGYIYNSNAIGDRILIFPSLKK